MDAVIGVLFLVLCLLLYKFTYLHTRGPAPKAWSRQSLPAGLAFAGILLFGSIGGCYVLYFATNLERESFGVLDGVLVVAFVATGWFGARHIDRQWRLLTAGTAPPAAAQPADRIAASAPAPKLGRVSAEI